MEENPAQGRQNVSTNQLRDLDLVLTALVIIFLVSLVIWLGLS
jgi:hypothetical protein